MRRLFLATVMVLMASAPAGAEPLDRAFDGGERIATGQEIGWIADWLERRADEEAALQACLEDEARCWPQWRSWRTVVVQGRNLTASQQLSLASTWVNRIAYRQGPGYQDRRYASITEGISDTGHHRCADIALLKADLLIRWGWDPADLILATVTEPNRSGNETHALLLARTSDGIIALDHKAGPMPLALLRRVADRQYALAAAMPLDTHEIRVFDPLRRAAARAGRINLAAEQGRAP